MRGQACGVLGLRASECAVRPVPGVYKGWDILRCVSFMGPAPPEGRGQT